LLKKRALIIGFMAAAVLLTTMLMPAFSGVSKFNYPRPEHMIMYCTPDPDINKDWIEAGTVWTMCDIVRASDLDFFVSHPEKYEVVQDPGFHVCYIGINCRDYKPESTGLYWPDTPYSPGDPNYPLNITYVRLAFEFLTLKTPLLGPIYGGIVEEAYTLVPPTFGKWHNHEITPFTYSPDTAFTYLHDYACWRFGAVDEGVDPGIWVPDPKVWKPGDPAPSYPDGYISLRYMECLYPSAALAPTSAELTNDILNREGSGWNYWLYTWAYGEPTGTEYVDSFIEGKGVEWVPLILRPFYNRDHDFYFLCYGLGLPPTLCYWVFHPETDYPGGDNSYGLNNTELTYWLERFMKWRDPITGEHLTEDEVVEALWMVQNLTFNAANPNCLAPTIPIYHRKFTAAFRKDLCEGWVKSPGYGSYPYQGSMPWTFAHLHPIGNQSGGTVYWCNPGEPMTMHPAMLRWVDEVFVANRIYGSGIVRYPLNRIVDGCQRTHMIMPWLIVDWSWEHWSAPPRALPGYPDGIPEGTKITYRLRQDVYWQDGTPVTAEDFAWDMNFIEWCKFPDLLGVWLTHVYTEPVDDYTVNVYLDQPGEFWMEEFMGAPVFQKEVWEQVCYPYLWYQDDPDPNKAREAALAFKPWQNPHPNGNPDNWPYDWDLTAEAGIGEWILKSWDPDALVAEFYRNPNFWVKGPVITAINAPSRVDPGTDVEFDLIFQSVDMYTHHFTVDSVELDGTPFYVEITSTTAVDLSNPICSNWTDGENLYHLASWEDNGDGVLSECDTVDFRQYCSNMTIIGHVEEVTGDGSITLKLALTGGKLDPFELGKISLQHTGSLAGGEHHITMTITDEETGKSFTYDHTIKATIKEDTNLDGLVDMKDMYKCALAYGSYPTHPAWDYRYDINDDFFVDMKDLYAIAIKYGWTW